MTTTTAGFTHRLTQGWIRWRSQWPGWWASLSVGQKVLPVLFVGLWLITLQILNPLGLSSSDWKRVGPVMGLVLLFSYSGAKSRRLMFYLWPLTFVAVAYDSFRYWLKDFISGRVNVSEPYLFELKYLSITSTVDGVQKSITLNEFFRDYNHWTLDFITGITYALYIVGIFAIAAWITLRVASRGTDKHSSEYISARTPLITWSFWPVNTLGHLTWMFYPAAPPWYVHKHGLGPANMSEIGDAAGLLRFDALTHSNYFENFYAQTTAPFGAIPSLHCAYAFITVYYAYKFGAARVFATLFFLLMCFSAVYLDHHYTIDVILGALYGFMGAYLTDWIYERWLHRQTP